MLTRAQQSVFRPIVDRAWQAHCTRLGLDQHDAQIRETWYRDQLWSAARIRSTTQADDASYLLLLAWFRELADTTPAVPRVSGFTDRQAYHYQRLAERAYRAAAARSTTALPDLCTWVAGHLSDLGIVPTSADRVHAFDAIMSRLAIIAGDDYWTTRTAQAEELRLRHLIRRQLAGLASRLSHPVGWEYAVGLWAQMRQESVSLPPLDDAPASMLRPVLQALAVHVRRLDQRADLHATDA